MTDQVEKISPFMDLLIEVDEHHKKGVGMSGKGLVGLSAGDQRRCFNEGIKNYGDEGKVIHNKFDAEFLKKCSAASELESLGKGLTFPIDEKKLEEINKIFEKIDLELTNDPRWNSFWNDQKKNNQHLSDSDIENIKSAILSGFRFKVIQMVGFNVMKTNPAVLNNYSSLMQTINGVKLKQSTGEIDKSITLENALAIHISQGEYGNKITTQDYLAHAEGKINSMPNDKKILPIFGKELADKAFSLAMQAKQGDKSFFHSSIVQAIKNKNSDEVQKLNNELKRVTGESLTAAEILTNPAYFETDTYKQLAERSSKEFHIGENIEFAKFYHDFKSGKLVTQSDQDIKKMVNEFLDGSGRQFEEGAKSEINIQSTDKATIKQALLQTTTEGKLERENLVKALDLAYTQVHTMLIADVNLNRVDMNATLTFDKPKATPMSNENQVIQTRQPRDLTKIQNSNATITEVPVWRRIGKAIGALFKYGLDMQAIRAAYFSRPGTGNAMSRVTTQVTEIKPIRPSTQPPSIPLLDTLTNRLDQKPVNASGNHVLDSRSGPPYTKQLDQIISEKEKMPDTADKLRSNMFNFLNNVELKGKELDHIRQQVGQAGINIASGAEPKQVIESLERSISMVKEEFGVKNPEAVKSLDDFGKKLNEFKERSNKINMPSSELEKKSTVKSTTNSKRL